MQPFKTSVLQLDAQPDTRRSMCDLRRDELLQSVDSKRWIKVNQMPPQTICQTNAPVPAARAPWLCASFAWKRTISGGLSEEGRTWEKGLNFI